MNRLSAGHARLRAFGLGALGLASLLFFLWLGAEVHTARTQHLDNQLRETIHWRTSPERTWLMLRATQLGSTPVVTSLSIGCVLCFLLLKWWRPAMLLAIDMAGSLVVDTFLKDAFHRPRPEPFFGLLPPHSYSFPSGHAFFAVCFYGMMAVLVAARMRSVPARAGICALAVLMIAMIGLSRIYLGVHYPSDVLGGWAAGLAWVSVLLAFDKPTGILRS